jgi:tRNA G10  N-methylase Trm11
MAIHGRQKIKQVLWINRQERLYKMLTVVENEIENAGKRLQSGGDLAFITSTTEPEEVRKGACYELVQALASRVHRRYGPR